MKCVRADKHIPQQAQWEDRHALLLAQCGRGAAHQKRCPFQQPSQLVGSRGASAIFAAVTIVATVAVRRQGQARERHTREAEKDAGQHFRASD